MPKKLGIELKRRPDSKKWQYRFRYKGNDYRGTTGEEDRNKAEEKAYKILYNITKETDVEQAGNISINDFMQKYLEYVKSDLRQETLKSYTTTARNLQKFIDLKYPPIKLMKEINNNIMDDFKLWGLETTTKTTVRNNIKNIKRMYTWALEKGLLAKNLLEKYKNFTRSQVEKEQKPTHILTLEELTKFSQYTKKHYPNLYPLYMTYIYTGARKTELLTLEWQDIDFRNKFIKIRSKKDFIPKTDERTIPLHAKLIDILKAIPRRGTYVFMDGSKPFMYPDKTKKKGRYESHKPRRYLLEIMKALGKPEFTRLHWLRHSYATVVTKEKGISFAQQVLGHKDISVTQRYVHFDRDYIQENLNKMKALDKIFK